MNETHSAPRFGTAGLSDSFRAGGGKTPEDIAAFTGRIIRFRDGQIISDEANPCPRRLGGEGSAC